MILYSFLGAGNLHDTVYEWQGTQVRTEFSCVACAKILNPEKIVIFETENGQERHEKLKPQLADIPHEFVMIADGKNTTELWQIFSTIVDAIPENAKIAFDVTNGFRFYPLLGLLAASFTETVKGTELKYMFYGNYEANREESPKPMIDLTPMLDLLKWTTYADRFIQTGDSSDLAGMLEKMRNNYPDNDEKRRNLADMSQDLKDISASFQMLRPETVRRKGRKLQEDILKIESDITGNPAEQPLFMLLEKIREQYVQYSDDYSKDHDLQILRYQRDLIMRYHSLGQYMQAVSLAREWMQTWVMAWLGTPFEYLFDWSYREKFSKSLNAFSKGETPDEFTEEEIEKYLPINSWTLNNILANVSSCRNDLDHAGQDQRSKSAKELIKRIDQVILQIKNLKLPDDKGEKTC